MTHIPEAHFSLLTVLPEDVAGQREKLEKQLISLGLLPMEAWLMSLRQLSAVVLWQRHQDQAYQGQATALNALNHPEKAGLADLLQFACRLGLSVIRVNEGPSAGTVQVGGSLLSWMALLARRKGAIPASVAAVLAGRLGLKHSVSAPSSTAPQADADDADIEEPPWSRRTAVMGILNVTPDSFSDGGHFFSLPQAVQRGVEMVEEGADIIDVGGESSRPGAEPVSEVEELRRVIPVIKALAGKIGKTLISVDTYKPAVAKAAVDAGAHIINDITGLRDERMVEVAAETGAYVVVMHMQGIPRTMQHQPKYHCVTAEVYDWLAAACARAKAAGVKPHRLIIDPGIGFGKATEHNLTLLQRLRDLQTLGYPVLVGTSRKSVIGNVLNVPVTERWEGNAATVALAVGEGVDIVRVHDVKSMRKVVQMSEAIIHGRVVAGG